MTVHLLDINQELIEIIDKEKKNHYIIDMSMKNSYSNDITASYPTPPKGFIVSKDHYTGWFFKSMKANTTDSID